MDNLKIHVVKTTNEMPISTEPPGTDKGHIAILFWKRLAHAANFLRQLFWYDLQRIYDSELKPHMVRKYQLE
ncbi:MAG: hypothetical protein AB8F94_06340 [Saprospiraceae bacterium]